MSYQCRRYFLILSPFILSLSPLYSDNSDQSKQKQSNVYIEEDVWFGPGFYYGIWFDDEDNYWRWRRNHGDYPSNRNYYHHDHPVYYSSRERGEHGDEGGAGGGGHEGGQSGGHSGGHGGGGHGGGGHR